MSFRMRPIYPYRVWVTSGAMENTMTKAETAGAAGASKNSSCCGGGHDHSGHGHHDDHADAKARDPVCGMSVDPATSPHRFDYDGKAFHFCSAGCRTKFAADPQAYLDKNPPKPDVPEGTIYTCPMHPQIRQVGPGNCPICGMALEP